MVSGGTIISSPRASLRALAGSKMDELEKYALQSQTGKRILTALYRSTLYNFITRKISEFRDYKLIEEVKQNPLPRHIAVIMDGNRRFAQELGLSKEAGHIFGRMKIEEVLDWCFELGVPVLTIYAFSMENFKRSEREINTLMTLFKEELDKAKKDSRIHQNKVRIRILGRLELLPEDIQQSAHYVMEMTKHYESVPFEHRACVRGTRGNHHSDSADRRGCEKREDEPF